VAIDAVTRNLDSLNNSPRSTSGRLVLMPPPPTPLHKRIEARAVAERVLTQLQLNMLEVVSVIEGHDGEIALTLRKCGSHVDLSGRYSL
jgi:hypothetical protein